MRFVIGVVLLFALGCAEPFVWTKPGSSYDEFARDRYGCLQAAKVPVVGGYVSPYPYPSSYPSSGVIPYSPGGMIPGETDNPAILEGMRQGAALAAATASGIRVDETLFNACMEARGWRAVRQQRN